MAVATVNYKVFKTHSGTLAEVATAVTGVNPGRLQWFYNGTNITAIEPL